MIGFANNVSKERQYKGYCLISNESDSGKNNKFDHHDNIANHLQSWSEHIVKTEFWYFIPFFRIYRLKT